MYNTQAPFVLFLLSRFKVMDSAGDPAGTSSASGRAHKMRLRFDDAVSRELEKKKRELATTKS